MVGLYFFNLPYYSIKFVNKGNFLCFNPKSVDEKFNSQNQFNLTTSFQFNIYFGSNQDKSRIHF